ncbi:MAG: hypothetical protein O2856_16565 [Planctomycetota bacterium]|nr:hypothetical protein [Planctomycetota bacterium]
MRLNEMMQTFSELQVNDPNLIRLLLQASIAALANVQSVETVDAALNRGAMKGELSS